MGRFSRLFRPSASDSFETYDERRERKLPNYSSSPLSEEELRAHVELELFMGGPVRHPALDTQDNSVWGMVSPAEAARNGMSREEMERQMRGNNFSS